MAGLGRRHPAAQDVGIAPGADLVGGDHQQLAQATGVLPGGQPAQAATLRPKRAHRGERLAQQGVGEAGAQRGEQGRAGGLGRPGRGEPVRPGRCAGLVQPAGLAIHGAEQHRQHGAFGQGLRPRVAHHCPARCSQVHFARLHPRARSVRQPQDAATVGALQRAGQQQAKAGGLQQGQQRAAPAGGEVGRGRVGEGIGRHVGQGGQVVHLVQHQQGAVAAELRQVQVGGSGDGLVGGDVALQAAGRVGGVVGGAHRDGVAERAAPGRVSERFLGLLAQAVARHHPADALNQTGREQGVGGDHRQQRFAAAGGDGGEDVGDLGRLSVGDGVHDGGGLGLVGAERTGS